MKTVQVKIRGTQPLLMHNERLVNPLDEHTRALAAVSKKRMKTIDDHELMGKLEFKGGIYHDKEIGPYVPNSWLQKGMQQGGTKEKKGKAIQSSVFIKSEKIQLIYEGPRKIEELYQKQFYDQRAIKVSTSKIIRTRPRFNEWSLDFEIEYDETIVDGTDVRNALMRLGKYIGIGDYRPRFGTFEVERFDE